MSEMVDRVARAFVRAQFDSPTWKSGLPIIGSSERAKARAILEEMREPTAAMVDEGSYAFCNDNTIGFKAALECWENMISEALSDKK